MSRYSNRKGAALVFMAVCGTVFAIFIALIVNVASMQLARTELRAATDAAAIAGAEALSRTESETAATDAAIRVAKQYLVGGKPLTLTGSNIKFGMSVKQEDGRFEFVEGMTPHSSVQVNASQDVNLAFASITEVEGFSPQITSTAATGDHEICLVVDRSHSMCFDLSGVDFWYPYTPNPDDWLTWYYYPPHPTGSRWAALAQAVAAFADGVSQRVLPSKYSLVSFSGTEYGDATEEDFSRTEVTWTSDPYLLTSGVNRLSEDRLIGGTDIYAGLIRAINLMEEPAVRTRSAKTIIFFTDGIWTQGDDPTLAASLAKDKGITIHVVALLNNNDPMVENLASATNGMYLYANNGPDLVSAFKKLASIVPVVLTE